MPKAFLYKSGILAAAAAGLLMASCTDNGHKHRNPGRIYAPDMTYSVAYDYYSENPNFADSHTARKPVAGTVARGQELPDHISLNDSASFLAFTTTMRFNESEIAEGKRHYDIHCGVCHGDKLDGNGPLYNGGNGKFAAAPANFKLEKYLKMPVGQMYHAVKFGINAMGSYASQLDIKERWQVIAYIKQGQSENGGEPFTMGTGATSGGTVASANADGKMKSATPADTVGKANVQ